MTIPTGVWSIVGFGDPVTEIPDAFGVWVRLRSVDDWPLAKTLSRFPGVSPGRYPLTLVST
jgi:hypothetical protein